MDYFCGPLTLYTSDKIRLIDFLSNVLEFEVNTEEDLVIGGSLSIKIHELKIENGKKTDLNSAVAFNFELKNEDELSEIVNKYNFFQYRNHQKNSQTEKLTVIESSELSIFDLDGREWRFKARLTH